MAEFLHPDQALFAGERPLRVLPACDHYAGTERFMRRALELQAQMDGRFDVTLDLEDGAPAGREREHAGLVASLVDSDANRHGRVGVRIHDGSSPFWRHDVETVVAAAGRRLAHLTLPKCVSADQAAGMIRAVQAAVERAGHGREIPIHVLIETHGALQDAFRIAALPWLATLEFGLMDFVSAHHGAIPESAMRSPGQFEHALVRRAKARIAAAAASAGLVAVHGVTVDLADPQAAGRDARRARDEFGYLRMWSIHPSQVVPILEAFAPDAEEVARAAAILRLARAAHWAPVRHEDTLHDRASYRHHWSLLQRARLAGRVLPAEVERAFFGP